MKRRIFWSMCFIALASIFIVLLLVVSTLYTNVTTATWRTLKVESFYVAEGLKSEGLAYLENVSANQSRITLIAPDGTVLFDDEEPAAQMENHLNRPEVAAALANGTGESQRLSTTLGKNVIYYAVRLEDGNVLRVSLSVNNALGTLFSLIPYLAVIAVGVVLVAGLLSKWQTGKIVKPINTLNLDQPLANDVYGELSPLLRRVEAQNRKIEEQLTQFREKEQEFDTITRNLSEGLVVLNTKGVVLSINQSARQILQVAQEEPTQQHILALNRNLALEELVMNATRGSHREMIWDHQGRKYHLSANPVWKDKAVDGVVLLMMDETEKQKADEMRREFSANVSHELKTPLTSISGYAEIMQNGVAKQEDMRLFAKRIYKEAIHLIALVEDIIKLSRLDEKDSSFEHEELDMLEFAKQVCTRLEPLAKEKGVTVAVEGESAKLWGVRPILEEVIHNLCENAIKYNRAGGSVQVNVQHSRGSALLTVTDTGIGIPVAEQQRVFERFYRVDKSHSKETGGTGLGLSIVKHGVLYHGGSIRLQSEDGKGTSIQVSLPAIGYSAASN
ncbi:MAG: ATP-binding protein [Oscillospiraceae bacterium]